MTKLPLRPIHSANKGMEDTIGAQIAASADSTAKWQRLACTPFRISKYRPFYALQLSR
jgi:hypothetical protein